MSSGATTHLYRQVYHLLLSLIKREVNPTTPWYSLIRRPSRSFRLIRARGLRSSRLALGGQESIRALLISQLDVTTSTCGGDVCAAVSFEENFVKRELRNLESHFGPHNRTLLDYLNPEEGHEVPEKDELGHDLSLNSRASM